MKHPFLLLGVLIFCLHTTSAQSKYADCGICVEGLQAAAFDTYSFSSENDFKSFLSMYFNMTDEQRKSLRNSSSTSAGIKAAIDIVSLGIFGSSSSEQEQEEFRKIAQQFQQTQEISNNDIVKIYKKMVNPQAVQAYEKCVTECIQRQSGSTGLAYSIEGDKNDEFILIINWRPLTEPSASKVSSFQVNNLLLKNGASIYNGAEFKAFTPLVQSFKRVDKNKPASISVSFVGLGNPISLTLESEDGMGSNLPLGTIIASTLNYQEFIGQIFDDKQSSWAPADGRSVANSKYGKKYKSYVPDVRGQFLRGYNEFYSPGAPSTIINNADPNDRRDFNGYSYQSQDIKPHSHTIKDPGHEHGILYTEVVGVGGSGTVAYRPYGHTKDQSILPKAGNNTTGITINNSEGKETRPNNLAVYYYIKIN